MLQKNITADQNVLGLSAVQRYLAWLTTLGGIIAVVAGTAATLAVFNAQYLAADVWGTSQMDYFGLIGAMFVSFVGAATVARVPGTAVSSAPAVTGLTPAAGPAAGGNTISIVGTHLAGTLGVAFGSTSAGNIDVQSDNLVTVTVPAGTAGATVDVTATTSAGTSATSAADKYTYE